MSSYDQFQFVKVGIEDRIATVAINRPDALNAINGETHRELELIWPLIDMDPGIDAVILTGEGRAFSAGGDVKRMAARAGTRDGVAYALDIPASARRIVNGLLDIQQPVIAAVNGDTTGLGATLALLCDITIIAEDARIGDTHVLAGLVAGDGGAVIWPLLVGPQRAKEYLMTGKLIRGADAAAMGLANLACPADQVVPEARAMAARILKSPKWAVRWTKLAINKWLKQQVNLILEAGLGYEVATLFLEDHKEAATAFVEKRKPSFTGF